MVTRQHEAKDRFHLGRLRQRLGGKKKEGNPNKVYTTLKKKFRVKMQIACFSHLNSQFLCVWVGSGVGVCVFML